MTHMHVSQVHSNGDKNEKQLLLKERNELADQVNRLEGELAARSAEASYMHERFAGIMQQATEAEKLLEEREKLSVEVAALLAELEAANMKVAEVESEAGTLWRTHRQDQDVLCDLQMQVRMCEDRSAELQQSKEAAEV